MHSFRSNPRIVACLYWSSWERARSRGRQEIIKWRQLSGLYFCYPLQCSCLENPRDGGAWWAAVYGVAQSRTLLKWLSSSSVYVRRRQWHPTPVLLPGKSHGWRSLVCCSPWGREESDTTEQLHFPFSLSCTGEGHGNPLQCSSLENPRDGGAWWAAVYGVAQSRTRLKRLSSSSKS